MYYIFTILIFVILTNFLIAVITDTYLRVISLQKQISYKDKADLNFEYNIMRSSFSRFLGEQEEFKILVFSNSKDDLDEQLPESVSVIEDMNKKEIRKCDHINEVLILAHRSIDKQ